MGNYRSNVHTDLHECLGHGSGKMLPGVTTEALRNYYSTIRRSPGGFVRPLLYHGSQIGRTGIIPSLEVAKAEYNSYIRNGLLVQLTRIKFGDRLEESHMRNRQTIAAWLMNRGKKRM